MQIYQARHILFRILIRIYGIQYSSELDQMLSLVGNSSMLCTWHICHIWFLHNYLVWTQFLCFSLQNLSMPQIEISTDRIRFSLNGHTSNSAQTFVWFHVFYFDILIISDNIKHTLSIQLISFSINCTWWKLPVSGSFDSRSPIAYENNKNKIDTIYHKWTCNLNVALCLYCTSSFLSIFSLFIGNNTAERKKIM